MNKRAKYEILNGTDGHEGLDRNGFLQLFREVDEILPDRPKTPEAKNPCIQCQRLGVLKELGKLENREINFDVSGSSETRISLG